MTVNQLIEALTILSKYMEDGLETSYFMGGDHDIVYFYVDVGACPEDSEDGQRLKEIGLFVSDADNWAKFV